VRDRHLNFHEDRDNLSLTAQRRSLPSATKGGAGDGDRTRVASLEGHGSTTPRPSTSDAPRIAILLTRPPPHRPTTTRVTFGVTLPPSGPVEWRHNLGHLELHICRYWSPPLGNSARPPPRHPRARTGRAPAGHPFWSACSSRCGTTRCLRHREASAGGAHVARPCGRARWPTAARSLTPLYSPPWRDQTRRQRRRTYH
jgi:hypothetical protein